LNVVNIIKTIQLTLESDKLRK